MVAYPAIDAIETAWRTTGAGVCVLVEGETELDDAWFYGQWFGDRSREITFFPQNGWEHVTVGVRALRGKFGGKRVYGIIDRDFASTVVLGAVPVDGIVSTPKYCLESYLLSPGCWFDCIKPYLLRRPKPDWASAELVQHKIESLYRECLAITAYNWTLRAARQLSFTAFGSLPKSDREDRKHPDQLSGLDPVAELTRIGARVVPTADLEAIYRQHLAHLQSCNLAQLEELVDGKSVLKRLQQEFPIKYRGKNALDEMLSAYMSNCPQPPSDLAVIVNAIIDDSQSTPSL